MQIRKCIIVAAGDMTVSEIPVADEPEADGEEETKE